MERLREQRKEILLVPIGRVLVEILEEIAVALRKAYQFHVRIGRSEEPDNEMYSDERRQHKASSLLNLLAGRRRDSLVAVLGVVEGDMFAGDKSFVFGINLSGQRVGVIALARLREEFYKKRGQRELFLRRAVTEAICQVGLAAGIPSCSQKKCVLLPTSTLWRMDEKGQSFCELCRERMELKLHPERSAASKTEAEAVAPIEIETIGQGPEGEASVAPQMEEHQTRPEPEDESQVSAEIIEPEGPPAAEEAALHTQNEDTDEPLVADAVKQKEEV